MSDNLVDQRHFFDRFMRFVETSETDRHGDGRELARLNARYVALVHENRDVLAGAHVLDLASHDGRFGFAALCNGAEKVVGIEIEPGLVEKAEENLRFYEMPSSSFEFMVGDIFDDIERVERCDVVFCFGILYHINDHMRLLTKIAEAQPRWLIIDSNIAPGEEAVIELRNAMTGRRPPPGGQFEGYPTKAALDTMLTSFGWSAEYFDWTASGLAADVVMSDYRKGARVSAVVNCGKQYPEDVREQAVRSVFERQDRRREQWRHIKEVASEYAMTPQALGVWVRKAEREALTRGE
jgi:Methyltransferase domain